MGDPVAVGILTALSRGDREAHRLVLETGLAQSSVYRKLREMTAQGLVIVHRLAFTSEGRKVELFRSRIRAVHVGFEDGRLRVEVVRREDAPDRLQAMWDDVRRFGR